MKLKITKIGNSLGVVLPKEALARLKVDQGDSVFLTEAPDGYRITLYDEQLGIQLAEAREIMRRRRNALRELAK
ncbi:MAG: AbrB/MazE/SpoVT family DNA-binding domain-containing protein [Alphaproteobacteria bacterium]|nr:MAG: AbrB/MazE/SpoVT family DNA-binding domain-containing protein [Alphaproteobacteria bacterium]